MAPTPDPSGRRQSATAFAPASVGNVGVGFDLLGHSIAGIGDRAHVRRSTTPGVRITAIRGIATTLPLIAEHNTAGRALLAMQTALQLPFGFEIELDKGIPLGSGLGGSAASAVAAVVAANALLDTPVSVDALYRFALEGEFVASGSHHGDNVAPMLLGGLTLASHDRPLRLDLPAHWHALVVHPDFILETRLARAALAGHYALAEFVAQSTHLALFLTGCARGDAALVRAGLHDVLVEPRRAALIPGFHAVQHAALAAGALGASISGAGPSVFGWFESRSLAEAAAAPMQAAFAAVGLRSEAFVSPVAGPAAKVLSCRS